ncbi:superfamily II DNA helicase RecQ, partial [Peptococcaceae bacterium DYL19]|nr:superfamily II DNA helicase RecQ [Phosphitispora fastidiosa]
CLYELTGGKYSPSNHGCGHDQCHKWKLYREKPCGNCDICLDPPKHFDATDEARKALSCVYRINQNFGIGYAVEVLRGMQNIRVRENGHD